MLNLKNLGKGALTYTESPMYKFIFFLIRLIFSLLAE